MASAHALPLAASNDTSTGSNTVMEELISNELVFAVVGPVGSGTSWVAEALKEQLKKSISNSEVKVLKASTAIENWANRNSFDIKADTKLLRARSLQDAGDAIRKADAAGVAVNLIAEIQNARNEFKASASQHSTCNIYILDSLKHPAEVSLLRSVYQEAFCLIGVVCETETSRSRLRDEKCRSSGTDEIDLFIARDQDSGINNGQKVSDTFHLADFFVDNTPNRFDANGKPNMHWVVNEQLGRLIEILTRHTIVRPNANETGMFHAYGAQMTSACLSRQVGAALLDKAGNLVSTGKNEVSSAGGGVYGGSFQAATADSLPDHRCAYTNEYCSSNRHQDLIIQELIDSIPQLTGVQFGDLKSKLKKTGIGRLLEFSRAVHAEMDALLTAARKGISPIGGRLFVTTFPCHYCARHIVSAGVDEVQFIEPYPKSLAFGLHGDAIANNGDSWRPPSEIIATDGIGRIEVKVLFRPFTGVAPRMYRLAFMKDRPFKSADGKLHIQKPEWASGLFKYSYQEVENRLIANSLGTLQDA